MIYTSKKGIFEYYGISTHLDTAIELIQEADFTELDNGRNDVDGDDVYINRFSYDTVDEKDAFFEAHKHYIDVHVVLSGEEKIGISDRSILESLGYDEDSDSYELVGECEQYVKLKPGKILICFPRDAHKVKIINNGANKVDKAVIKVKIN